MQHVLMLLLSNLHSSLKIKEVEILVFRGDFESAGMKRYI